MHSIEMLIEVPIASIYEISLTTGIHVAFL